MKWRFHPAEAGLTQEAESWNTVNRQSFESHPLLDTRFLLPLVGHFGTKNTKLATLEGADCRHGALLVNARSPGIWSSFLPSQAQIAPVVLPPGRVDALYPLMRQLPSPCWLLEIMRQDREYSCFRDGFPAGAERVVHARTMRVNLSTDFTSYWRSRPKGLRKHLRRYLKVIDELARPVTLRLVDSPSDAATALKRYGDLEVQGWKGASGTAVHADNVQGRFYADVLENFAHRRRAYVYELYFGDHLAASRLCIASDDMLVILKTTYDETLAHYAPGRVLLYRLLESEFRLRRHRAIEFYTNANKETLAWGSESRDVADVNLFRNGWVRRGVLFSRQSKRALKAVPAALAAVVRGRETQTGAREHESDAIERYRVELVATHAGFEGLRHDWERACDIDGYDSIFISHRWFDNFIREIVRDGQIAIYVVRAKEDGTLKALFPMMRVDRVISWLPSRGLTYLSNFYSPVAKPIYASRKRRERVILARAFVRCLREESTKWAAIDFNMLPRESRDFEVLREAFDSESVPHTIYFASANWIQPTSGLTAAEYTETLPSILKNTVRRRLRRAQRSGDVVLHVVTDPSEVVERIDDYNAVYARSWKRPEPYQQFHRRLVERLAPDGKVVLGLAYFDGRPVAAQIWLFHKNVASIVKLCYDEGYKVYSFGTILTNRLMSFAIDERDVVRIDYLSGDEAYKRDWMSVRRERWGIVAFNERSAPGRVAAFIEISLKPRLKRLLGQRPPGDDRAEPVKLQDR